MCCFILLFCLIPFSYSKTVEFGLKLLPYGGFQDDLVFGLIDLPTFESSLRFKGLIEECLKDYLTSEIRSGVIDLRRIEGRVGSVQLPAFDGDQMKIGLTGDANNLHFYLMTMITSYYKGKVLKLQFYDMPTVKTFRKRPAKIGEVLLIDYERVFTGFEPDPLWRFLIKSGGSWDSSESGSTDPEIYETLLPRRKKRISKEKTKVYELCYDCNCCQIS